MRTFKRFTIVASIMGALVVTGTTGTTGTPDTTSTATPNGSSDGRYHTCGYVTEDGVTEHLVDYADRCGANR